ncbi:serine hydrolase domain-containing protein [uncultured Draconibacterium sp.]|uniref:serine hydrolase domain-containing protein n=1 Tax=uncultured Draconibacterium sp. TaxID=1573823 RepID=UPI0029C67180|nr:serine hydrolase domain-containing protein [uncultured Draconibacterium sp.]
MEQATDVEDSIKNVEKYLEQAAEEFATASTRINKISILKNQKSLFMFRFTILIALFLFLGCSDDTVVDNPKEAEIYFPPTDSETWENTSVSELGWNEGVLNELYDFLKTNNTRAFLILENGRIVVEEYWGKDILNISSFDKNSKWYWASAGKSLTAVLVGIAQQEGMLSIDDKTSDYLGNGWTNMDLEKENLITIKHQLSMTSGLNHQVGDLDCTLPECLTYGVDAGEEWFYHNAPYTLLEEVVATAADLDYNRFTAEYLGQKTGINGNWIKSGYNNIYWSTARDAARFGLLIQNEGEWNGKEVVSDKSYFNAMVNTSQNLNLSYGYLWWLNGKGSVVLPGFTAPLNSSMSPHAPDELIAAMGKNGQFIEVLPSESIVVVRMGEAPGNSLLPVLFHDEMWEILMRFFN